MTFSTIVATIETTTISPTGTYTLTLSDFQWIVRKPIDPEAGEHEGADAEQGEDERDAEEHLARGLHATRVALPPDAVGLRL